MDILVYLFKNRSHEYLNINSFKNEESDKTSVDNTHTQGACGRESTDSPAVSVSHPPTIDAEYVFISSNIVTIFKITLINDYLLIIKSIMRSKPNFSFICYVKSISKFVVPCNLYNFYWVWIDMNHALPHSLMMLPLPRFIYTFKKKGRHKSLWIIH